MSEVVSPRVLFIMATLEKDIDEANKKLKNLQDLFHENTPKLNFVLTEMNRRMQKNNNRYFRSKIGICLLNVFEAGMLGSTIAITVTTAMILSATRSVREKLYKKQLESDMNECKEIFEMEQSSTNEYIEALMKIEGSVKELRDEIIKHPGSYKEASHIVMWTRERLPFLQKLIGDDVFDALSKKQPCRITKISDIAKSTVRVLPAASEAVRSLGLECVHDIMTNFPLAETITVFASIGAVVAADRIAAIKSEKMNEFITQMQMSRENRLTLLQDLLQTKNHLG